VRKIEKKHVVLISQNALQQPMCAFTQKLDEL